MKYAKLVIVLICSVVVFYPVLMNNKIETQPVFYFDKQFPVDEQPPIFKPKEVVVFNCEEDESCRILAEVVYYEARGEPTIEAKAAVAHVVLHRTNKWYFPDTVKEVVYQRCAFSYTCEDNINKPKKESSWKSSLVIAEDVLFNNIPDLTGGADHYYNPKKVRFTPNWAKVYPKVAELGNHVFHKRD